MKLSQPQKQALLSIHMFGKKAAINNVVLRSLVQKQLLIDYDLTSAKGGAEVTNILNQIHKRKNWGCFACYQYVGD